MGENARSVAWCYEGGGSGSLSACAGYRMGRLEAMGRLGIHRFCKRGFGFVVKLE